MTYGGRLPSTQELETAMANYTLSSETDDWEWCSDYSYAGDQHALAANGNIYSQGNYIDTAAEAYRCWIPK